MKLSTIFQWILRENYNWNHYGLESFLQGIPTELYHGTTAKFNSFDLSKNRKELVDDFYGSGIFFTPSITVAWKYANANRNKGLPKSIIDELKLKNYHAGLFLEMLCSYGQKTWEMFQTKFQLDDFQELKVFLDVDPNTLSDISKYVVDSVTIEPEEENLFGGRTGAPDWLYDSLDEIGLKSSDYRPKVYKALVSAQNVLVTGNKEEAKMATQNGYDAILYHGSDLVDGVPEVAVFNSNQAKIIGIEQ